MAAVPTRAHVGESFSEAAKLLWGHVDLRSETPIRDLARTLKRPQPTIWRLLYGERRAGRDLSLEIETSFPEIEARLWQKTVRRFTPPLALKSRTKAA
jgi:hypothetical protein